MSYRAIVVLVELDDDLAQGDEIEMIMSDIEGVVNDYNRDRSIKSAIVEEMQEKETNLHAIMIKPTDTPVSQEPETGHLSAEARQALGWS